LLRKIAAILLLSILLFNWVGYRLFTAYRESRETAQLEASLDMEQYDSNQLILLRVSADALPYSNPSDRFERAEGAIEIGHLRYRYVKKRLYNDSLEFLCIPDGAANRLQTTNRNFFSLINDLQKTGHTKIPGSSGKMIGGLHKIFYLQEDFPDLPRFTTTPVTPGGLQPAALLTGYPRIGKQPPRALV
jgi:hypothetical protein